MTKLYRQFMSVLLFLIICPFLQGQRLNTGLTYEFFGIHAVHFPSDIIFSETNYSAYYVDQFQTPADLNMNIAGNIVVDYSRLFMSLRGGIFTVPNGVKFRYEYPVGGDEFTTYYSKMQYFCGDISLSIGYFMNAQRFMKPYLEAGVGRVAPYMYNEDMSDDPKFLSQWTGREEIKNTIQLDKSYTYLLAGVGLRGDLLAFSARYRMRIGDFPVYFSTLSFGITIYTKFSNLRKHYIYQPED